MASFDILYRGDQSGFKIPEFDKLESAEKDFYGNIIKGAETEYLKKEKDEADFLGMMKTNPVLLISDKTRTMQAEAIEKYNNKWASTLAKKQGSLNLKDKMEMQRDKEALGMFQNTLLADQQRYQQEQAIMDKDIRGFYDRDRFNKATQSFYETGKYPTGVLVAAPQEFVSRLRKVKRTEAVIPRTVGGRIVDYKTNMTQAEAEEEIANEILTNEGSLATVLRDFEDPANVKEAEQFLVEYDVNKNGIIDPAEKRSAMDEPKNLNNPIIKWAQKHYAPMIMTEEAGASKAIPGTSKGGLSINFGGRQINYEPPTSKSFALSNDKYSNEFYPLNIKGGSFKLGPTAIEVDSGIELPIDKGKSVNATIVGYDAEGDYVLLQQTAGAGSTETGTTIIVPRADIANQLPDLKINKDGQIISITANTKSTEPKQPTKDWSKYKR